MISGMGNVEKVIGNRVPSNYLLPTPVPFRKIRLLKKAGKFAFLMV
jgi:hypothetical protein